MEWQIDTALHKLFLKINFVKHFSIETVLLQMLCIRTIVWWLLTLRMLLYKSWSEHQSVMAAPLSSVISLHNCLTVSDDIYSGVNNF